MEISQFEKHHAVGPRLAPSLLLCTGQQRTHVVHNGRQHIDKSGSIDVR